jgi:hypothetical protein
MSQHSIFMRCLCQSLPTSMENIRPPPYISGLEFDYAA